MVFKVRGGVVKIIENLTKVFFFFGEGVEVGRMYVREFLYIFKNFWFGSRVKVRSCYRLKICKVYIGGEVGIVRKVMKIGMMYISFVRDIMKL